MPLYSNKRKLVVWLIAAGILLTLASRIAVGRFLANDTTGDGVLYAQLARNILEQHVYSIDDQPPYEPTLIRLPGYPLFLAGVYAIFGHGNNAAVHTVQAIIDTGTCVLIALIAWNWDPDERRRRTSAAIAFVLAALCPFMVIYVGIILTETITVFLACAMALTATYALKSDRMQQALFWWVTTGLLGGLCVTFRPDAGLFLGGIGLTLVLVNLFGSRYRHEQRFNVRLARTIAGGALMSVAFAAVLVPWAIRNERLFHVFQPLAPAHAEMPGEFVPLGYNRWLRTWIDDQRYIDPLLWALNDKPILIDDIPESAFDSPEQQSRVAALLDRYNHAYPQSTPSGSPENQQQEESDSADGNDSQDESSDQSDTSTGESDNDEEADTPELSPLVAMTPEIDAEFGKIADERIARSWIRYHVLLPAKRAAAMWFDTHSQYYPFDGELFPLSDMDHSTQQHLWLPLFTLLTWIYTVLALYGAYFLFRNGAGRQWVLLAALMTLPRLAFFATLENPEPRYVIELFAFTAVLGGIAIAKFVRSIAAEEEDETLLENDSAASES
jgi:4-amino-4-deoxy-L-arabinose transferase-like glycosyltransferase